ncbi:P-loop containing nucleoside triphosphate hydrolase protein [Wilcoxina mikolae CBS 423.85]|nr:P-loop containing nucleoside triphosphate hydrolase protein [Wilcoxina mikolae CBS 423.85]
MERTTLRQIFRTRAQTRARTQTSTPIQSYHRLQKHFIFVLGDTGSGMLSFAVRYTMHCFAEYLDPYTLDCLFRQLSIDGTGCINYITNPPDWMKNPEVWDLRKWMSEFPGTPGFILLYSITSRESFEGIRAFYELINPWVKESGEVVEPAFILVGNKSDLHVEREVDVGEGETLAKEMGCEYCEVSAKTGENVEYAVHQVLRVMVAERNRKESIASEIVHAKPWQELNKRCAIL